MKHIDWLYRLKDYKEQFGNYLLNEKQLNELNAFCDTICLKSYDRNDKKNIILGFIKSNNSNWCETYQKMKLKLNTKEYYTLLYGSDGDKIYKDICERKTKHFDFSSEKQRERSFKAKEIRKNKPESFNTKLEFYLHKGMTNEDAVDALKKRQTTFTHIKCIEKYGEDKGNKIWEERQKKWQHTLNNKTKEESYDILMRKMNGFKQYSNISQELFNDIYDNIKEKYPNVYYATHKREDICNNGYKRKSNYEYYFKKDNRGVLLDFYIPILNKVIEFDGVYWHNKHKNDKIRKKFLQDNFIVLYITDIEYKNDKELTLKKCIKWILNND